MREHRKKYRSYPDSDKGGKGGKKGGITEAKVAKMIAEAAAKKEKELEETNAFRKAIISDLKGMIDSQVAAVLGNAGGSKKTLQRAGDSVTVGSADAEVSKGGDEAAERCAENLMSKFNAMGFKANKKTG